jgi:gas vesicle structural protein
MFRNPAEAINRLNISSENESVGLPELIDSLSSSGAKAKTKGVLEGARETLLGSDDEDEDNEKQRTRRQRS